MGTRQGGSTGTEKELRKLNRYQLLELLMIQTERVKELETQLAQLESRQVQLENLGSMAEASLQLSGVLEAAQKAADLYLEAAKNQVAKMEEEAKQHAQAILEAARNGAEK